MVKPLIQIGKCWQTPGSHIVWQIQARHSDFFQKKKIFLKIDPELHKISLESDRGPDHPKGATAIFPALSRKYLTQKTIKMMYVHPRQGAWISLGEFWVIVENQHIEIVQQQSKDRGLSLVRLGSKGSFSHKKERSLSMSFPETEGWSDGFLTLFKDFNSLESETKIKLDEFEIQNQKNLFQRDAIRKITRKIRTVGEALTKTKHTILDPEKINILSEKAQLLKQYSYLIKDNDFEVFISKDISGLDYDFSFSKDPDKTVAQELQDLFIQIKKQKKSQELGIIRKNKEEKFYHNLIEMKNRLESEALSEHEILSILEKAQIKNLDTKNKNQVTEEKKSLRKFYSEDPNVIFFVGKTAEENDALTKKAKSQDHWCHIVEGSGPHVIVKGARKPVDQKIKKEAAILAIHFSRFRKDQGAEVYWTQKSFVKKSKNMPEGLWKVEKSDVIFFRYDEKDLQNLLNRKKVDLKA